MADGIVVVDRDGIVRFANPATRALLGVAAGQLAGRLFGFPLVVGATTEVDVVDGSGTTVVEMRTVEMVWQGEPAYLCSLRDITDRRRAEDERAERTRAEAARAEAEAALQARDAFLALAAHELKTPLTRLSLAVQSALRGGAVPPREALHRVDREAAHLSRLVRQLLDVARTEGGVYRLNRADVDLGELVQRAVAAIQVAHDGRTIGLRVPDGPVVVSVDGSALEDVLTDLLASAVRYTPSGSPIEVELGENAGRPASTARIVLRDHGAPVSVDVRAALTAASLTSDAGSYTPGPGIALHLARRVVEMHGGELAVEFPDDGGTCVVLVLPLSPSSPPADRPKSA
jgi:signal transduction histidine kinase